MWKRAEAKMALFLSQRDSPDASVPEPSVTRLFFVGECVRSKEPSVPTCPA